MRRARKRRGAEPGGIDDCIDRQAAGFVPAEPHLPTSGRGRQALDPRSERNGAAGILHVALQGEHESVAVDDAGPRGVERRDAGQLGL